MQQTTRKKQALTRVQNPTPALVFVPRNLDLWRLDPEINGFPKLTVEHFYVKFGDAWKRRLRQVAALVHGWHCRQLQRTLTAIHLATHGDKPRQKPGEEAHRLPLPYAGIWRLLAYLSSFMSAHVCSQLTTKARRNRRRSFNFRSCIF